MDEPASEFVIRLPRRWKRKRGRRHTKGNRHRQSGAAEAATQGEGGGRSSQRNATAWCEFIAKTGFLATARENNNTGANRKQQKTVLSIDPGTVMRD